MRPTAGGHWTHESAPTMAPLARDLSPIEPLVLAHAGRLTPEVLEGLIYRSGLFRTSLRRDTDVALVPPQHSGAFHYVITVWAVYAPTTFLEALLGRCRTIEIFDDKEVRRRLTADEDEIVMTTAVAYQRAVEWLEWEQAS